MLVMTAHVYSWSMHWICEEAGVGHRDSDRRVPKNLLMVDDATTDSREHLGALALPAGALQDWTCQRRVGRVHAASREGLR